MQKELTIQELETINLDSYKDKPCELIEIGKKLVSSNRHEKAMEVFEFGLKTVISLNNNDEFHIDCAKFNYYYADVLIAKMFESTDIFHSENLPAEEERKETKENSDCKSDGNENTNSPAKDEEMAQEAGKNNNNLKNNNMEDGDGDEDESEEEGDDNDEKVNFFSNFILKCFLNSFSIF